MLAVPRRLKMAQQSQGDAAEEWFREFANQTRIINPKDIPLEQAIALFNSKLQLRLNSARLHVDKYFPFANAWIDLITSNKRLPENASATAKTGLSRKMLDLVLATDVTLTIKDNQGIDHQICVDVTADPVKESGKYNTIQGKREDGDPGKFNRNQNLPAVRKALGFDKHLVLVINPNIPPETEKLLAELYAFANSPAKTRSINLHSPTPKLTQSEQIQTSSNQTPQQLWEYYRQQVPPEVHDRPIKVAENAAFRALRNGVDTEQIKAMLVVDPSVQQLAKRQGPESVDHYLTTVVNSAQQQLQGWLAWKKEEPRLTAIATLNYLNQKGQELAGDGKEKVLKTGHRLTFQDNVLIIAKGDRTILQIANGQIQFTPQREDQELLQELRRGYGNIQQQTQQQQRLGPRR
jgi:hypothetical protein